MDVYSQMSLRESLAEIRLLYVHSSDQSDSPLSCDLCIASLGSKVEYAALSYVWGEPIFDHSLDCNDGRLPITKNLHHALQAIRTLGESLPIWVDQICINQNDIRERNSQIGFMGQIYSGAKRTLVYLGEATEESAMAKQFVPWIWLQTLRDDTSREVISKLKDAGLDVESPAEAARIRQGWHHWLRLFERPWFKRVWVLQEAIKAPAAQLLIGNEKIGAEHFMMISLYWTWNHHMDEVNSAPIEFQDGDDVDAHYSASDQAYTSIDLVRSWKDINHLYSNKRGKLIELLSRCRSFQATDPRDKIYALLGLCTEEAEVPRPDYALSASQVYLQYGQHFVNRGEGVLLLKEAGKQRSTMDIPSWVPDWTTNLRQGIDFEHQCCAAEDLVGEIHLGTDPRVLFVKGARIDKIVDLGSPLVETNIRPMSQSELLGSRALKQCLAWHAESWELFRDGNSTRYQTMTDRREGFARLVMLQTKWDRSKKGADNYFSVMKTLTAYSEKEVEMTVQRIGSSIFACVKAIALYPQNRRFCVTSRGYIGLVPAIAEEGDVICVVPGAKPLYVISEKNKAFELIGDAFVLEMMNGEALQLPNFGLEQISLY